VTFFRWMCWLCCLLWTACAGAPRRDSLSMDSATTGCLRNPACAAQVGQDAIVPWLSRTAARAAQAAAVMRAWDEAEVARVEHVLVQCAKEANFQVNERLLGEGKRPTAQMCMETVVDAKGRAVTWGQLLGEEKHVAALACVQRELGVTDAGRFSLEPRYLRDARTGRTRWLDPEEVKLWIRDGMLYLLTGSISPVVVLHAAGDPLKVQRVYDFKFPCPVTKPPKWDFYSSKGHPYEGKYQDDVYQDLLKMEQGPFTVSPNQGVN
jgi:hypothetical protein